MLGQRAFTRTPVLIGSINEDVPRDQLGNEEHDEEKQEDEDQLVKWKSKRKRDRGDEVRDLRRYKIQREMDERRAKEAQEWMDRLFGCILFALFFPTT